MSTTNSLAWHRNGAGYLAEASPVMRARVAPFGCSWSWSIVEGGVVVVSGIAATLSDAFEASTRQAARWPLVIAGAQRHGG
jgi:hypothetical protein